MSRIELEQISEDEIEVVLPPETPMEMATELIKGLQNRGLVENLAKSTVSVRYFSRPTTKTSTVADELIKSLQKLTKNHELPYWHPKSQFENQKRVREMEISERRAKNGIKQPTNVSTAPEPHVLAPAAPKMPPPSTTPKMYDTTPATIHTAGGTGRRYATIPDPITKQDDEDEVEKSGYGPKGAGQYSLAENIRRKANNTGDAVGAGPNVNVKSYSSKPGQLSAKQAATVESKKLAIINRKQPVKLATPEEIDVENKKRGLTKSWGQHLPFPSAEEEIMKLAGVVQKSGEESSAQQLADLLAGKKMLGDIPVGMRHMFNDSPAQPNDQQMFGHLEVTEGMAKTAQDKWNKGAFGWLAEAQKPIAQKFRSEEEESAYWNNIKVSDRDEGQSGY